MTFGSPPQGSPSSTDTEPIYADPSSGEANGDGSEDPGGPPSVVTVPATKAKRRGGIVREILETALIALAIFLAVRMLVLNFRVDGESMLQSLHDGDMLLVNRNAYESWDLYTLVDWIPGVDHAEAKEFSLFDDPKRGDVVVFDPPVASSKPYIKRIIGLPGETIEVRDCVVYVDGATLEEPYITGWVRTCTSDPVLVPEGMVFVMGDNRDNSSDSRSFGPVDISSIEGRAWVIYWPVSDLDIMGEPDYPEE